MVDASYSRISHATCCLHPRVDFILADDIRVHGGRHDAVADHAFDTSVAQIGDLIALYAFCFGAALAICADMVGTEMRGRTASIVLGGLMLAAALGVPMATLIDQHMGWRASFWLVVILTVLCALVINVSVPRSQPSTSVSLRAQLREFRNGHLWAAYATSALIIGATFAAFSYFTPILTQVAGFSTASIPWLLGSYGVANIVGNVLVGRYADKYTFPVMAWGLSLLTITLVAFALFAHIPVVSVAMLLVVGLVGVTMNPAMVARVMKAAQPGPLVNTVHTSVINVGLGMGTWLGGLGIGAGFGLRSPLWGGVLLAVLGLISLMPYLANVMHYYQRSESSNK
ncbi:MFS transporter [Pseudomonas sp. UM16]|uniref:MFS transporter n=1 Tax=Pseudomonas sp. UM16 TaxID=3158962 RepID=UPI00398FD1E7